MPQQAKQIKRLLREWKAEAHERELYREFTTSATRNGKLPQSDTHYPRSQRDARLHG